MRSIRSPSGRRGRAAGVARVYDLVAKRIRRCLAEAVIGGSIPPGVTKGSHERGHWFGRGWCAPAKRSGAHLTWTRESFSLREWRNWHTRRIQVPVFGGSTPPSRTRLGDAGSSPAGSDTARRLIGKASGIAPVVYWLGPLFFRQKKTDRNRSGAPICSGGEIADTPSSEGGAARRGGANPLPSTSEP